jgi:hypothetical protein
MKIKIVRLELCCCNRLEDFYTEVEFLDEIQTKVCLKSFLLAIYSHL